MHTIRKALLLALAVLACCVPIQAQNIEGQLVAAQFGAFQVTSNGNGFTFPSPACQVNGGGKNFMAFAAGTPIKIVDANPSLTEVVTPLGVFLNGGCSVSLATAFSHTSFYLTSGTGGLQEAINNGRGRAGSANTIVLTAAWYEQVAPSNPATVIATVTGGAGFGLVDVTTSPYTYYSWNGSQFVSVGTGGGGTPTGAAGGALTGSYPNPVLSPSAALSAVNGSVAPGVTPAKFGAIGDGIRIQGGCTTTVSSTSVSCAIAAGFTGFVAGDVGKQFWISGAGASGVTEQTTISSVTNANTVVVANAVTTAVTNSYTIYGHDDTAAIQACWNYSSANQVPCVMAVGGLNKGYLQASNLQIATRMKVSGNSHVQGTNLWCEVNGDCVSMPAGPVQGVNVENLEIWADATQPNSRGIHLNPTIGGGATFGEFSNGNFTNVEVENTALECLWLDGGGGAGYAGLAPNQYINFFQFNCNGPQQQHNAALIKATGEDLQIMFLNGAVNGFPVGASTLSQEQANLALYPNAMVDIEPRTNGLNDAPGDMKFYGYTVESGSKGLFVNFGRNIHYENSYMEQLGTGLVVQNSSAVTFNGNILNDVGFVTGVISAPSLAYVSVHDNSLSTNTSIFGGLFTAVSFATCANSDNYIDFSNNTGPTLTTANCATNQIGDQSSSTLSVPQGNTVFMNGSATAITTITAPTVAPGKTLTLYGGGGSFILASGGNINFGGYTAPLTIAQGASVTLTLFDLGPSWLVTSMTPALGGAAGGGLTGTYPNPGLSPSAVATAITAQAINPASVNRRVQVLGFTGAGIGVAQAAWSSSTAYPQCSAVSSGGASYLAVAANTNVTPGTNSAIWYPVPDANTPTQGDCAFYTAASTVSGSNGAEVDLPPGVTLTNIGWLEPTVTAPGNPTVNIFGAGKSVSTLQLNASLLSLGMAPLQLPNSGVAYAFASFVWSDFAINANFLANAVVNVYGAKQFQLKNLALLNAADGSDHYLEFGHPATANHTFAWTYEADLENIDLYTYHGAGSGAQITASVTGGVPTFTIVNGGSQYTQAYTELVLSGAGAGADVPCSNRGSDSITVAAGVITAITSTATGCSSTLYASIYGGQNVNYGVRFNDSSDSKLISSITDDGIGSIAGFYMAGASSELTTYKLHPVATMIGVQDAGNNNFFATQMDTVFRYGFDFEGATNVENVYGTLFEWNNQNYLGSSDYHFGTISNSPTNSPYAINIFGDTCGNAATFNGYNHLLSSAGSVDSGSAALPTFVHLRETNYCNQTSANANTANYVGQTFSFSNGNFGNVWQFGLGQSGSVTNTVTNPSASGSYTWLFSNPTAATGSQNYGSPVVESLGTFWNGTASSASNVQQQLKFGSGASPAETYAFTMGGTVSTGAKAYSFDRQVSSPGFFPQAGAAGPYSTLFDDYYSGANNASNPIGAATGDTCTVNTTYTDNNHPGNLLLTSGTGGSGTGITCGYQSEAASIFNAATSLGWTWETAVYVPVLPGTTAGSYQAGLTHSPNTNPWTGGIHFYLSSANAVANDWYCGYSSTYTDSTVAATVGWQRLTIVNDGSNVHWYVNGTQVCGSGVPITSMPSTTQYPAAWSATSLSGNSVSMAVDYVDFQRATVR